MSVEEDILKAFHLRSALLRLLSVYKESNMFVSFSISGSFGQHSVQLIKVER